MTNSATFTKSVQFTDSGVAIWASNGAGQIKAGSDISSSGGDIRTLDGALYSTSGGSFSWNFGWSHNYDGDISSERDMNAGDDLFVWEDVNANLSSNSDAYFEDLYVFGFKSFVQPHPETPELAIVYQCLEGPSPMVQVCGNVDLIDGYAEVELPPSFQWVTSDDDLSVFLTPFGETDGLYVDSVDTHRLVIRERNGGRANCRVSWQVIGHRIYGPASKPIQSAQELFEWAKDGEKGQQRMEKWYKDWLRVNGDYLLNRSGN